MNCTMDGEEAVPIIITHRVIKRQQKINTTRKFVGVIEGLKTLAIKAIDLIQDSFWKDHREIIDPGESKVVHYAIDVEDDGTDPDQGNLIATRIPGTARPGFGAHFEVVRMMEKDQVNDEVIRVKDEEEPKVNKPKRINERPKPKDKIIKLPQNLDDFEDDEP